MKRLIVLPDGWQCSYADCRPGLFVYDGMLGLKTEYGEDGYCDSGESFSVRDGVVQPVNAVWEMYEE